jgi:hypothetical protein
LKELDPMRGEKIYEYEVDITGMADFGVDLASLLEGSKPIPPQGARFDVAFAGQATGRLSGSVRGTDFAYVRPDGCFELNIFGVMETIDGMRISLAAGGIGVYRKDAPIFDLSENVRLLTAAPALTWVNERQIWATGTANLATGKINIEAFLQ